MMEDLMGSWGATIFTVGIIFLNWAAAWAQPVWQNETGGLPETDIRLVVPVPAQEAVLAASARAVYRRGAAGGDWKRVAGIRTPDDVMALAAETDSPRVWLATRRTLRVSVNGGRSWKTVFRRESEAGFQIRALSVENAQSLLVGTTDGLHRFLPADTSWSRVEGSPQTTVDSILSTGEGWVLSTAKGIYRTPADFKEWRLLEAGIRPDTETGDPLGQFAIEEISTLPAQAHAVIWPLDGRVLVARRDGLYESPDAGGHALRRKTGAEGFNVRQLAADERFVYWATDRGVYRVGADGPPENISTGLESQDIRGIAAHGGDVWAATRKGLFRMRTHELPTAPAPAVVTSAPADRNRPAFVIPASEPTVTEIQQAAIRYAEVHPEKIEAWRAAAAKKAWLPTVSLDTDFGEDQNVDIDRGGTNDPDRFIIGPKESNLDWSVGVSWDLGNLIWNDDQTSIDARSRLMVELRNDILNDVTHLYFERRRTQMELAGLTADVPKLKIDKGLKLDELTAQIDALTGGYLSSRLAQS